MSKLPFNRRDLLKLGAGGIVGSTVLSRARGETIQSSAGEETFLISYPTDREVAQGETTTFNFSVEQIGEAPDGSVPGVGGIGGGVGFRYAWRRCEDRSDEWECTDWDEYTIDEVVTGDGIEWREESPTTGSWGWSTPKDLQQGDLRDFSVSIQIDEDATPGTHEISLFEREYPVSLTAIFPPDEERFVSVTVLGPELELTAEGDETTPGGEATVEFTLSNTREATAEEAGIGLGGTPAFDPDWDLIEVWETTVGDPPQVIEHPDDEGDFAVSDRFWRVFDLDPDDSQTITLTWEVPEDIDPGEYEVEADELDEPDVEATATIEIIEEAFDPAVHGFNFPNWGGECGCREWGDAECGSEFFEELCPQEDQWKLEFTPQHRVGVESVGDIVGTWLLSDERSGLGLELLTRLVHTLQSRQTITNGHCYGMVFTAKEFFENPDHLPESVGVASEIHTPVAYQTVGDSIRIAQTEQILESETVFIAQIAFEEDRIDLEKSMTLIEEELDQGEVVPVGLGEVDESGGHQVLVYDYEENGETVEFYCYDPNQKADDYEENQRSFEVNASTGELLEPYGIGYNRYSPIGPDRDFEETGVAGDPTAWLWDLLGKLMIFVLNSPASVEIDAPTGTKVRSLQRENDFNGIVSDAVLVIDSTPGSYEMQVVGDGEGEFGLEVYGNTDIGGEIAAEIEGDITDGEIQTFTAEIPDEEGEEGEIREGPPDEEPSVTDYANDEGIVDTDGLRDAIDDWRAGDIDTGLLRDVIDAWRSGDLV